MGAALCQVFHNPNFRRYGSSCEESVGDSGGVDGRCDRPTAPGFELPCCKTNMRDWTQEEVSEGPLIAFAQPSD
jgi:hypothetical protein